MGKKSLSAVLVASMVVLWGFTICTHAQQGFSPAGVAENQTASLSLRWENKTFTRYTYEEDIRDTFRAIAKIVDVPITFGEGITEVVSMEFKDMPLRDAFDFLLRQYELEATEDAQAIHVFKPGRGGTQDALFNLVNLQVEEVKSAFERFGLMKRELRVVFDPPTKSIFVSGPGRDISNIQKVIAALEASKKKEAKPEIRNFPLRYAKVQTTYVDIGKQRFPVPGLETTLIKLLALTKPGEIVGERSYTTYVSPSRMNVEGERSWTVDRSDRRVERGSRTALGGPLPKESDASADLQLVGGQVGVITSDARANTIIIRDYPEKLDEYAKIIKQLDVPFKMVKLDVIIVEAGKDFAREVGVGWSGYRRSSDAARSSYYPASSGTARDVFGEQFQGTPFTPLNLMPLPETAAGAPISAYGLAGTFIYAGAQWNLFGVLSAAETRGLSRTVNKSSIVTMDNTIAIVEAKTTITYKLQTGGDNPTVESRDIDAGIRLTVTPHILEGEDGKGMVELFVMAERSSFLSTRTDGIPEKAITTLTTQAAIGNEATLVVGGLFENRYQVGETGIPCLMNVPVAGYLFKTASARDPKSNILFFMSPTIISLDKIPYEGTEMKETVERSEHELRQIDPEKRRTLIEKRPD